MATNPLPPFSELIISVETIDHERMFHCVGRITSDTVEALKREVKPSTKLVRSIVLDLTGVSYMDSSGLGTIAGLYVTAKAARCGLTVINLNERLKELFSLTRLGEVLTTGRDPEYLILP